MLERNRFSKRILISKFGEQIIKFPEKTNEIYNGKKLLQKTQQLNSYEGLSFFKILPLLVTKQKLENMLFQGFSQLAGTDFELINRNKKKTQELIEFTSGVESLPECFLVNSLYLGDLKDFLKDVKNLNWKCEFWQDMRYNGINEMIVDMALGGTHYIKTNWNKGKNGKLKTYSKLTSLVSEQKKYLCIDSIESDEVDRRGIYAWKNDGLLPDLLGLIEGALTVSRILKYDGVIFRTSEVAEMAKYFSLPQKKFKGQKKGRNPNYCKAGIQIKTHAKDLYRNVDCKNRFLSPEIFPFSKSGLEERIESFDQIDELNEVQKTYLRICSDILDIY